MGWEAAGGSWTGGQPGREHDLRWAAQLPVGAGPAGSGPAGSAPARLVPAGFDHGGSWSSAAPSAALAFALETAAGPDDRYAGADTDALVGIARQWAAVESWAVAGKLAALRAMAREDGDGTPRLRRRSDLPEGWDDGLTYEISGALAMGPVSADNLASLAWTLGTRLAGIGRLLASGTLTFAKARLVAQLFGPLDDDEAARAEALVLGELAGKTYLQVERLAWRAALAVAPDVAERRRKAAEREHARVTVFREESGTVGLSGRDLPAAEALAGHASVVARAREYAASGVFPGQSTSRLEAQAYTDLLNGISARDRIAFAASAEPPGGRAPDDGDGGGDASGDSGPGGTGPGGTGPGGTGPGGFDPGDGGGGPGPSSGAGPDDGHGPGSEPPSGPETAADLVGHRDRSGDDEPGDGDPGGPEDSPAPASLAEVTVPLATLQRRAERAGENRLLGPLDPALARDLAAAAARSPASRWEVTVVDARGYATGHGIARPRRGSGQEPPPTGSDCCALPARVNITITETLLHQLQTRAAQPRPGAPPGAWALTPGKSETQMLAPGTPDTWELTLPGGQQLAVRFDVVPVYDCDHRYQVSSYLPGDRLRRLVQVRDHECTWPPCSRAARESDFEHAVPYDQGGVTDACNAGARSRRCHRVKQLPGWTVTQPRPGWHVWRTPTGRTYGQEPWRYTA